jgi:hypothetical protein
VNATRRLLQSQCFKWCNCRTSVVMVGEACAGEGRGPAIYIFSLNCQFHHPRGDVDRMLALVVGGAAAVTAVALLGYARWIEAVAPPVLQPAYGVAVAVGADCGPRGVRHPFGGQGRPEAGAGLGWIATAKPMRSNHGRIAVSR